MSTCNSFTRVIQRGVVTIFESSALSTIGESTCRAHYFHTSTCAFAIARARLPSTMRSSGRSDSGGATANNGRRTTTARTKRRGRPTSSSSGLLRTTHLCPIVIASLSWRHQTTRSTRSPMFYAGSERALLTARTMMKGPDTMRYFLKISTAIA